VSIIGVVALNEPMTFAHAERGDVDGGQRSGCLKPQPAARLHRRQPLLRTQDGQGAFEPLQIVDISCGQSLAAEDVHDPLAGIAKQSGLFA
jgi:hypothetical protein